MPDRPQYRIIYNWDGAPHGYSPTPQSLDSLLDKAYAPLIDTQVDALFWSGGGQGARWPSDVLDFIGEAQGRRYQSAGAYTSTEIIRQMYDRGDCPRSLRYGLGGAHYFLDVVQFFPVRIHPSKIKAKGQIC